MMLAGVIPAPGTRLTTDEGTELEVVDASARPPEEADPGEQHPPV